MGKEFSMAVLKVTYTEIAVQYVSGRDEHWEFLYSLAWENLVLRVMIFKYNVMREKIHSNNNLVSVIHNQARLLKLKMCS